MYGGLTPSNKYQQMSFVAIIGAGSLGGALTHHLALGDRVPEIRLIDSGDSAEIRWQILVPTGIDAVVDTPWASCRPSF